MSTSLNFGNVSYAEGARELETLMIGHWLADFSNFASFVFHSLPDLNWAGFYLSDERKLVLGPFMGKPACTEIAFGRGVCGTAFHDQKTLIVPNVHEFPGHIACDAASQSELVIPLALQGKSIGVLDLDSPRLERFTEKDREGLELWVGILLKKNPGSAIAPSPLERLNLLSNCLLTATLKMVEGRSGSTLVRELLFLNAWSSEPQNPLECDHICPTRMGRACFADPNNGRFQVENMNTIALPHIDQVRKWTKSSVNDQIDRHTQSKVQQILEKGPEAIRERLIELDQEWHIDRVLMLNFSVLVFAQLALAATKSKKWLWGPLIQTPFMAMHAIAGWCPPSLWFRPMGFRTRQEIETEREQLLMALSNEPAARQ